MNYSMANCIVETDRFSLSFNLPTSEYSYEFEIGSIVQYCTWEFRCGKTHAAH